MRRELSRFFRSCFPCSQKIWDSHRRGLGLGTALIVFKRAGGSPIFCLGLTCAGGSPIFCFCVYWFCDDTVLSRIKYSGRRGSNRGKRGGSWNNNGNNCRSANRNNNTPTNTNNNVGFRLSSASRRPIADVYGYPCRAPVMTRLVSCSGMSGQIAEGPGGLGFAERPPAPLSQRGKAEC